MKLTINGESTEQPDGQTVAAVIDSLGLAGRAVAVELNRNLIPKREHEKAALKDGDELEIVTLVGGG